VSKIIASAVARASHQIVREAEEMLNQTIEEKGGDLKFEFPDTAYSLSQYYRVHR